jgi:RNA-directed DNA polymerase
MKQQAITNQRYFLSLLNLKQHELNQLIADIPKLYTPYIKREVKKDGKIKEREICPSIGKLKIVQTKLKNNILDKHFLPDYIHGGRKGKDSISNSAEHKGKHFKFCLDLKNFFPSVKNTRVNKVLLNLGYTPEIAHTITKLVTFGNKVPQGAPTSSVITNLVFYVEADIKIEKLIEGKGITYTRYVDDLNFSSQYDFKDITLEIIKIISDAKFKLSRNKSFYKVGKVIITGVEVGQNVLNAPKKLKDKLTEEGRSELSKKGIQSHIKRIKAIGL